MSLRESENKLTRGSINLFIETTFSRLVCNVFSRSVHFNRNCELFTSFSRYFVYIRYGKEEYIITTCIK